MSEIANDCAVEVKCVMRKEGGKGMGVGEMGVGVKGVICEIKWFEGVGGEAGVRGD
ncbi:hypothetical protein [Bacillus pumilus]|uniref:hypothetical protein n=1 Tax=Bacillus pumilus TaxID=1408 RepID=UPI003703A0B6